MSKGQRGIRVMQVFCPKGKSVAFGQGYDVHTGEEVRFLGDFHHLYNLATEIYYIRANGGGPEDLPIAAVEAFQVAKVAKPGHDLPTLDAELRPYYEDPPTPADLKAIKGGKP